MARKCNNKNVDFEKLKTEFYVRGLNASNTAKHIGREKGYFASMKMKGYLSEATILLLDAMLGIKYEDIKPSEEAVTAKPTNIKESAESVSMTKGELRFIITEAVKDAFVWYANR